MKIFVYGGEPEDSKYSETELAESPSRGCDSLPLYAVVESPVAKEIFAHLCEMLGWRNEVPDGCSRAPSVIADDILLAAKRADAPFTMRRAYGDGMVEVVSRDFKRGVLK